MRVMPFDVYVASKEEGWSRIVSGLSDKSKKTLVVLSNLAKPEIYKELSPADIKLRWDKLFKNYPAVRALGLGNLVYLEPISKNAKKKRAAVFEKYAEQLRLLKENPQQNRRHQPIDGIFNDISLAKASSNEIALFQSVWKTDISKLFEKRSSLAITDEGRITDYVGGLRNVLQANVRPFQCSVTISTSLGPGAEIKFFKSLFGKKTAISFGISKAIRQIERASWTFVSYRTREGRSVETGSAKNVNCHDHKHTLSIVIQEVK